jgi:hypothetical protein
MRDGGFGVSCPLTFLAGVGPSDGTCILDVGCLPTFGGVGCGGGFWIMGLSDLYGVEDGTVTFTLTSFICPLLSDKKKIASIIMIEMNVSPTTRIRAS